MENKNINAHCSICGRGYHVCNSCKNEKKFRPWKTVTDTIEHYKIYMAIHGYTVTKNREKARTELQNCDLSELESFNEEIKTVIKDVLSEPKTKVNLKSKKDKQYDFSANGDILAPQQK